MKTRKMSIKRTKMSPIVGILLSAFVGLHCGMPNGKGVGSGHSTAPSLGTSTHALSTSYKADGWWVAKASYDNYFRSWTKLNISTYKVDKLRFGQFNNDKKADIFLASGGKWYLSYSGTSSWTQINTSSYQDVEKLRFYDFNGDGKTDVFTVAGGQWRVSYSGTSSWYTLGSSSVSLKDMRFGDFNGDGKADIFAAWGGKWYVSYSGTSSWAQLNISSYPVSKLRFGDFNGDGKTDVFTQSGNKWLVSYSGSGSWTIFEQNSSIPYIDFEGLRFGKFYGGVRTDILYSSYGRVRVCSSYNHICRTWLDSGTDAYDIDVSIERLRFADFDGNGRLDLFRAGTHRIKPKLEIDWWNWIF